MLTRIDELKAFLDSMEMVDLTFTLESGMPTWPTHPRFYHDVVESYALGDASCHYQLVLGEHCGTHIDAPAHFIAAGPRHLGIDRVPLTSFYGRAVKVEAVDKGENGLLTRENFEQWEQGHGKIGAGDIVLLHFGWDRYWAKKPDYAKFMNNWPGLAKDAAQYLVEKKVKAVGTDAMALDVFTSTDFPAHNILLGSGILIIENLNNLSLLPDFSLLQVFPLKIKDGSGSPIRAIAYK
ncbi:kynurenine formamidase [Sporomusaceae bacterium BoRhaA]|uniref:cyclase family protein n=1 Tax=Pelorhabdus rhamnosifermentans TaxID=2772457 RepID=UPI001C05F1FF|nr:cyclase family protein [Pelorhabdus rhamnosifermentans]MBU2703384.1 kynurenine formamidase [Pelorhabdus rhamnosifermentans]